MHNRLSELLPASISLGVGDVVIEPTLKNKAEALVDRADLASKQLLLVCDSNTHKALGERVASELKACDIETLIFEATPRADRITIEHIRGQEYEALIAVGAGTISDICKYASFVDGKPYVVFPTAPSMNGYLSANASVKINGHKQTLHAHLPKGVYCDLEVMADAPIRLIRSGLGDSLCRSTAQADWLLSHLLFDTPYTEVPFELLKPFEEKLFAQAGKLISGDIQAIELLVKTLLVSGVGMVIADGSYPASEGEHLIAHLMEMKYGANLPVTYHGEQIGVTTLTMTKIQEEVLSRKLHLMHHAHEDDVITSYFGPELSASVMDATRSKQVLYDRYEEVNASLATKGDAIHDAIKKVMVSEEVLRDVLLSVGAPTTPAELGWNERDYDLCVSHARFIRDRFTFLDLL